MRLDVCRRFFVFRCRKQQIRHLLARSEGRGAGFSPCARRARLSTSTSGKLARLHAMRATGRGRRRRSVVRPPWGRVVQGASADRGAPPREGGRQAPPRASRAPHTQTGGTGAGHRAQRTGVGVPPLGGRVLPGLGGRERWGSLRRGSHGAPERRSAQRWLNPGGFRAGGFRAGVHGPPIRTIVLASRETGPCVALRGHSWQMGTQSHCGPTTWAGPLRKWRPASVCNLDIIARSANLRLAWS